MMVTEEQKSGYEYERPKWIPGESQGRFQARCLMAAEAEIERLRRWITDGVEEDEQDEWPMSAMAFAVGCGVRNLRLVEENKELLAEVKRLRVENEVLRKAMIGPASSIDSAIEHLEGWSREYGQDVHGEWLWRIAKALRGE